MRRTAFLTALLVTSAVPALNGPAFAVVQLLPKELIELAPDLVDIVDTAIKIATNDVPSIVSEDVGLSEYAKRVAKVRFGHEFPKEAAINGDRVFSPAPEERANARKEYADFVAAEADDIERIKVRRDDRAAALKAYELIYKRFSEYANRAPDLIGAAGKAHRYELAVKFAEQLHATELVKPDLDKIATEYRRLVNEYDEAIMKAELRHAAHVAGLKALDAVMPPKDYRPPEKKEPQARPGPAKPGGATPPGYADRLQSTVNNSTAPIAERAGQAIESIQTTRQRIGPPPTTAPSTYAAPAQQSQQSGYSASMSGGKRPQ